MRVEHENVFEQVEKNIDNLVENNVDWTAGMRLLDQRICGMPDGGYYGAAVYGESSQTPVAGRSNGEPNEVKVHGKIRRRESHLGRKSRIWKILI